MARRLKFLALVLATQLPIAAVQAQPIDIPLPAATTTEFPAGITVVKVPGAQFPGGHVYVNAQGRTLYGMDMRMVARWSVDTSKYCKDRCEEWEPLLAPPGSKPNLNMFRGFRGAPGGGAAGGARGAAAGAAGAGAGAAAGAAGARPAGAAAGAGPTPLDQVYGGGRAPAAGAAPAAARPAGAAPAGAPGAGGPDQAQIAAAFGFGAAPTGMYSQANAPDWTIVDGPAGPQYVYKGYSMVYVRKGDKPHQLTYEGADGQIWNTLKFVPPVPKLTAPAGVGSAFVDGAYVLTHKDGVLLYTGRCSKDCTSWKPLGAGVASQGIGEWTVDRAAARPQWLYRGKPVFVASGDQLANLPRSTVALRP